MKFQFAQSTREIEALSFKNFQVVQDNRSKTITVVEYVVAGRVAEMSFMNGVEAVLNNRGRYIQAQSNKEYCAKILPEPVQEPTVTDAIL